MSEDCQAKPRPRPAPRTRVRQRQKEPDSAVSNTPVSDVSVSKQVTSEPPRAHRPAPSPPNRSPASDRRPEGSKPRAGSLTRSTSGSTNSSPIVAMRSEAAKLATMATEAERRVKEMSSERNNLSDEKQSIRMTFPSIHVDQDEEACKSQDVVIRERRKPPDRPLSHVPTQFNNDNSGSKNQSNTTVLSRVSQKPDKLDFGVLSQTHGNTLAVQYPGYTPTTPPDIDLSGGQLVRFAGGFEIWETYASNDYDRRNRDSNPIISSAEFELEKRVKDMDLYTVELKKDKEVGLGLSVSGTNMSCEPSLYNMIMNIYVKAIHEDGPAAQNGQISVGDQVVEVDGHSLVGVSAKTTMEVFHATGNAVRLQLGREKVANNDTSDVTDNVSAGELEALRKENQDLIQRMSSLETARATTEAELLKTQVELASAQGLIEELHSMKRDAELQIKSLEDLVSEQTKKCNAAESDKALAAADAVAALEQLQEEEEHVVQLQERVTELEERVAQNDQLLEAKQHTKDDSEEAISQLHNELEESRQQLTEWEEAYTSLRESHDQTLQELDTMNATLAEERQACKQAEDDVAELDEAIIGEQQRANKLQEKLVLAEESLCNEVTARKQLEVDYKKIMEAERLLRQKAERDLEDLQRKISNVGVDIDAEAITHNRDGATSYDRELSQAIPPTELLDVSASKHRSQLSSYSHRRRPSQYLLKRYAQEEQARAEELLFVDYNSDEETMQDQDEEEETAQEEEEVQHKPIGAQVQVEKNQTTDDIQNKYDVQTTPSLLPVREAEPVPRTRATTVARSKLAPPRPMRKLSLSGKPIDTAATEKEKEDEVDASAFKRSFTVSGPQSSSVKALGALLSKKLPLKPSDVKKHQTSLPVVSQRLPSSSASEGSVVVVPEHHKSETIIQDEQDVQVDSTKLSPEENIAVDQLSPLLPESSQCVPVSVSSGETDGLDVDDDGNVQDQDIEVDDINVEVNIDKGSSRPEPPTRPLPAYPLPTSNPSSTLSASRAVDDPITDTHEGLVSPDNVSETSSLSSTSFSPGDPSDTTLDASLPITHHQPKTALEWGQSEVSKWLETMKLEQYIAVFQEHGIEGLRLIELDESLLKAMGVSSAHRAIFKKEVKGLKSQLEKHRKMEKKKAEEEAKLEKKRLKEETKSAKKRKPTNASSPNKYVV